MKHRSARMDLRHPIRTERISWHRTHDMKHVYRCPACGKESGLLARSDNGRPPEPPHGSISCFKCLGYAILIPNS